ncbi:alpha/beta fold hydrolase [Crocosphaera chwakensis]|uniref:Alpha/beta hydrolase fold protein n=1 Tax=Crocosphaera chwakensis CCY0110 TaxID=391612 RepID=A3IVG5_9CHRO|nr:alpha/beta hydrolase [Crocosphaera chwakensis]EAZ89537.1 Alpha/beta hydrolase fold protein [Crocosphaera chwakensis CCY0110]
MKLNITIKGQGYPILCLHGHPGSGHSLSVFTDHLSERFLTISPDLRGYGNSRYRKQFEMEDHLIDLKELLDDFNIEQCLLLGWSLGGILALELILQYPEKFTGLMLIASAARPYGNHPKVSNQELVYAGIAGILNYLKPGWQWNINTFAKKSLFRYLIGQQTPIAYKYLAKYGVKAYLQTSQSANQALSNALKARYNRLEELDKIDIPCLVLAGSEDRHITAQSSKETANHLRNSQYICYPNHAHLFPWEIPEKVLKDIDQWLSENRNYN